MTSERQNKMRELLRGLAAEFFNREAGPQSLITVTDATISPDFKRATIYLTTLPSSAEEAALEFAKRKRTELREYIGKTARMRMMPMIEVKLDLGERHRQKIDDLFNQV